MKKTLKLTLIPSFITLLIISILYVFTYGKSTQQTIQYNQLRQGEIVPIPQDLTLYSCFELKSILGGVLKVCELKKGMGTLLGQNVVRGEYHRDTNIILLDKDSPNDRIVHELGHYLLETKRLYPKENELLVQNFQNIYLQLIDKKLIKFNN